MKSIIVLVLFSTWSPSAVAMGRGSNPCEPAMNTYCGGVLELGHEQLVKCLLAHKSDLPQECKKLLEPKSTTVPQSYEDKSSS
jgi:hypothetical protein